MSPERSSGWEKNTRSEESIEASLSPAGHGGVFSTSSNSGAVGSHHTPLQG